MKTIILFKKDSPMERDIDHFIERLDKLQVETQKLDADSPEGAHTSELYDLLDRPSVVLVRDSGEAVERWQGQLPLPEEVSYLAHS